MFFFSFLKIPLVCGEASRLLQALVGSDFFSVSEIIVWSDGRGRCPEEMSSQAMFVTRRIQHFHFVISSYHVPT